MKDGILPRNSKTTEIEVSAVEARLRSVRLSESLGRIWYEYSIFWYSCSIVFFGGLLCFLASWYFWHQAEGKQRDEITVRQLIVETEHEITTLQRWYETAIQTLKLSALHPAVRGFEQNPAKAAAYFEDLSFEIKRFSQLRILKHDGTEALRVDSRHGQSSVVHEDLLQNKAGRYYFAAAKSLKPGQVYISRLDLNVDNDLIEVPFRPTTRLITPIVTNTNAEETIGYVVINMDMAEPLSNFIPEPSREVSHELLNRDGYWLAGVSDDKLWGFVRGRSITMKTEDGALWQKLSSITDRGDFTHGDMLYRVGVLSVAKIAGLSEQELFLPDQPQMYILAKAQKYDRLFAVQPIDFVIIAVVVFLIAAVAVLFGYLFTRRKQTRDVQERITNNLVAVRRMAALGRIVAGVAHEMRTPLGNALSVTTTIANDLDELSVRLATDSKVSMRSEDVNHFLRGLHIIEKNIQRTSSLLRNFRQTAADQSNHTRRNFDLVAVAKSMVETMEGQLAKKGILLTVSGPETAPIDSYSDAIDQLLISLVGNSEQHAFVGRATGQINLTIIDLDEFFYQIVVADDGIGIDASNHDRIFEPFWSGDQPERGTGLGLTIVANIVEGVLGGEVSLESTLGEGTRFTLIIPKIVPQSSAEAKSPYILDQMEEP